MGSTSPYPTFFRTDLVDTKIINFVSEWELLRVDGTANAVLARQDDTDMFRHYELAASTHVPRNVYPPPGIGLTSITPFFSLYDLCLTEGNDGVTQRAVTGATLFQLNKWIETREPAPVAERLTVIETSPGFLDFATDEIGGERSNVLGGIRSPSVDVPIARYDGRNGGELNPSPGDLCDQGGSKESLDQATLDEFYRNHGDYVSQVTHSAQDMMDKGFLRDYDFVKFVQSAAQSDIGN